MAYGQSGIRKQTEGWYAIGIWAAALLAGILTARLGAGYCQDGVIVLEEYFRTIIRSERNYGALLWHIVSRNTGRFALFFMAQVTVFGLPVMICALIAFGAAFGFFAGLLCVQYGGMGALITAACILPQAFVYVPAAFRCLYTGYRLNRASGGGRSIPGVRELWMEGYLKQMAFVYGLLLIGSAAEALIGTQLLCKVLELWNG